MEELLPELQYEFNRWIAIVGEDPYAGEHYLGIKEVLRAHFLVVNYFAQQGEGIGGVGPRSLNLLHSCLSRQTVAFGQQVKWQNELEICATLFYGLIKTHPFHDGNKRTAFLSLLFHLWKVKHIPTAKQKVFETLALRIASNQIFLYKGYEKFRKRYGDSADAEVHFIARFLKRNTRHTDKRTYIITYKQLDTILHRYGFALRNPQKNYIDVVRIQESKRLFRGKHIKYTRITRIPFPGWNREVNKYDIKRIRQLTGLHAEQGYDSEVFFHGIDPLPALIHKYHGLLQRLANR